MAYDQVAPRGSLRGALLYCREVGGGRARGVLRILLELFLQLCYLCLQRGGSFLMTLLHVPQSQSLLKFGV